MKKCPFCNGINGDGRTRCSKCGRDFSLGEVWRDIVLRTWDESGELRLRQNSLSVNLSGKRTEVPLGQIVSVSIVKEPASRMAPGMIEIKLAGTADSYVQVTSFYAVSSGNCIRFPHGIGYGSDAHKLQRYIVDYQAKATAPAPVPVQAPTQPAAAVSAADEIKKYKELLDMGAITQDEFDQKKKQLLGL